MMHTHASDKHISDEKTTPHQRDKRAPDRLRISGKLLFAPLIIIALFSINAVAVYVSLHQQMVSMAVIEDKYAANRTISEIMNDLSDVHSAVIDALVKWSEGSTREILPQLRQEMDIIDKNSILLQDLLKSGSRDAAEKKLYDSLLVNLMKYRKAVESAAANVLIDGVSEISLRRDEEESFQALRAAMYELAKRQDGSIVTAITQSTNGLNDTGRLMGGLFVTVAILSFITSFFILKKKVVVPLKTMEIAARKISEGDLSFDVNLSGNDEIGRLNHHLQESFKELGRMLQRIKELSARISKVVEEVEGESKGVLSGTEREAAAIEEISAAHEVLNAASSEIADSTEHLAESTGNASASVEEMVQSISSINGNIHGLSEEVESTSSSISQLSSSVKQVASNAGDLAAASEQTLAAVSEITATIKEVETTIKESARQSEKVASDASTFAITSVEKTIEGMKNIQASVEHTSEFMTVLDKRSMEIGKILNVIEEVTDKTTLLALNATIIAAQAGESGRGFAIVAEEMKDLAQQTAVSTNEIASLIQAVQEGVKNASQAMEMGKHSVEEGFRLAQDSGTVLKNVVVGSKRSAEMALAVERTTVEQARAAHVVTDSMSRVKNMTDDIARTTAEQSKSVILIMNAAEKMKDAFRQMSTATEEQTSSSKLIASSVETIAEGSVKISLSLSDHKISSKSILNSIEGMKMIPVENRTLIYRISNTLRDLQKDSELLKTEMERFRFSEEKKGAVLKLGIVPLGSPAEMFRQFGPLADFLSEKLGKKVYLKVGIDFAGAIDDIGQNVTDLCFMGAPTYLKAHTLYGNVKVITRALRKGRPYHHAAIITRADSGIASLSDLKGRTVAFANEISTAGHIVPRTMLKEAGIDIDDLKFHTYMGHHDDAAIAVIKGDFDAGCVMEAIAYKFMDQGLKILQLSGDIPEFGICCNTSLDERETTAITKALASLNDSTQEGAGIVRSIDKNYTGFIEANDAEYDDIKKKMMSLGLL